MLKLKSWRGKLRGKYVVKVRGTSGKMPHGITLDEYKKVANAILKKEGTLYRHDVRRILQREIPIKHFRSLVAKLREEGRLSGYQINLDARPIFLRRLLEPT